MFLIRFNDYTGKYYKYDTDDHDMFAPMFDDALHIDNGKEMFLEHPKTCAFCNTEFPSRNQLFYHLGYHNIDIRKKITHDDAMDADGEQDPPLEFNKKKYRRQGRKKRVYWHRGIQKVNQASSYKKITPEGLTDMLRLIDIKKN